RRLARIARFFFFLCRFKNVALIRKLNRPLRLSHRSAGPQLVYRFSARDARLFQAPSHALLFASIAPALPPSLRLLQQTQLLHRAQRTFLRPSVRPRKRKARSHKQRGQEESESDQARAPKVKS